VSVATVDRVIHNRGKVSEENLARINEVLRRVDYRPNLIARSLASGRRYTLCAVMPRFAPGEYWADFEAGIARAEAEAVQRAFMNEVFRVYTHDDVVGVELAGALKNVAALCCGISDGCGMGDNTRALLITRALSEISRLAECMGGRKETLAGLAGMGDLIVTCTSMHSRNHRAGILIGQGKSAQEAMDEVGAVVEGYYAARSAHELAQRYGVEMPISTAVYEVLYEGKSAAPLIGVLMSRTPKKESDCSWL